MRQIGTAYTNQIKGIVRYKMWCTKLCKKTKNELGRMDVILLRSNHQHNGHSCGHPDGLMGSRMKPASLRRSQRQRIPLKPWYLSNKPHDVISQKTWPWRKTAILQTKSEALLRNTREYFPKSKLTTEEAETPNWVVMGYNRIQLRVAVFRYGGTDSDRSFWIMNKRV